MLKKTITSPKQIASNILDTWGLMPVLFSKRSYNSPGSSLSKLNRHLGATQAFSLKLTVNISAHHLDNDPDLGATLGSILSKMSTGSIFILTRSLGATGIRSFKDDKSWKTRLISGSIKPALGGYIRVQGKV